MYKPVHFRLFEQSLPEWNQRKLNTDNVSVNLLSYLSVSPEKLKVFQAETQKEAVLVQLKETVETGWPERKDNIPCKLEPYSNYHDLISVTGRLLIKSNKLIVPKSIRSVMFDLIYEAYLGIVKCKTEHEITCFGPACQKKSSRR